MIAKLVKIKEKFCLDVVIKLDKIIQKCLAKKQKEAVEQKLDYSEAVEEFAEVFEKNKDDLANNIMLVQEENRVLFSYMTRVKEAFYKNNINEIANVLNEFNMQYSGHKK